MRQAYVRPASAHGAGPDRSRPLPKRPTSARPSSAREHNGGAGDPRKAQPPKPSPAWGPTRPGSAGGKGPQENQPDERDDSAWLQYKLDMSGRPQPEEGQLTVVIEYCWNSSSRQPLAGAEAEETAPQRRQRRQLSTQHSEERYHEEALLVKAIVEAHYPDAHIFLISIDFRAPLVRPHALRVVPLVGREEVANPSMHARQARLGAFEVDARYCVAGELVDVSLWSKLATQRWISWPGWQDTLREALPIFHLLLRPAQILPDAPVRFPVGHAVRVLDSAGQLLLERTVDDAGVPASLLRGVYQVHVSGGNGFRESASLLDLREVPPLHHDASLRHSVFTLVRRRHRCRRRRPARC